MNPLWPVFAIAMLLTAALLFLDVVAARNWSTRFLVAVSDRWLWLLAGLCLFDIWRIGWGSP